MGLLGWFRKEKAEAEGVVSGEPRKDAKEFVLTGDRHWGNSITWSGGAPAGWGPGRVVGWSPVIPVPGDILLVQMHRGWSQWIFQSVERSGNPADMFFADVTGLGEYIDPVDAPSRERLATQRIENKTGFIW